MPKISEFLKSKKKKYNGIVYSSRAKAESIAKFDYNETEIRIDQKMNIIAEMMIRDDEKNQNWIIGERNFIKATLIAMLKASETPKVSNITRDSFCIKTLTDILSNVISNRDGYEEFIERAKDSAAVRQSINILNAEARQTRDSYLCSLSASIAPFASCQIAYLTSTKGHIDVSELIKNSDKKPTAIFISCSEGQSVANKICMHFVKDTIDLLIKHAKTKPFHKLECDWRIILNEAGNMPPLENLATLITTTRSFGIFFLLAFQSYEQMAKTYGAENASTIEQNCDLTFFLGANSMASKKKFQEELGAKGGIRSSYDRLYQSITTENRPLIRISDLDMDFGWFYIKSNHKHKNCHLKSFMTPYFSRKDIQHFWFDETANDEFLDVDTSFYDIDEVLEKEKNLLHKDECTNSFNFDLFGVKEDKDTEEQTSIFDNILKELEEEIDSDSEQMSPFHNEDADNNETPNPYDNELLLEMTTNMIGFIVSADPTLTLTQARVQSNILLSAAEFGTDEFMISVWRLVKEELEVCSEEEFEKLKESF